VKISIYIVMLLIMINIATATDCISDCTLAGNHYKCTGAFDCNEFISTDYSIYLYNATITYVGQAGGVGTPGISGMVTINSPNKVKIDNVDIVSVGGAGGDGSYLSSPNGGAGGTSGLTVNSITTDINNLSIIANSGAGGNGDAHNIITGSTGSYSCTSNPSSASGGLGGNSILYINSNTLNSQDLIFTGVGGKGGNAQVEACVSIEPKTSDIDVDVQAQSGANGGTVDVDFITNTSDTEIINITGTGGNSGSGDVDSAGDHSDYCDYDVVCNGNSYIGANGGTGQFNWEGINDNIQNLFVIFISGTTSTSDALTRCVGGISASDDFVGETVKGNTPEIQTIYIKSTNLTLNGIIANLVGQKGGAADADYSNYGSPSSEWESIYGGTGGSTKISILTSNAGIVTDSSTSITAGQGGTSDSYCYSCTDSHGDAAANGGTTTYVYDNISISGSVISNSGNGGIINDNGPGGHGGATYVYTYGLTNMSDMNGIFTGGDGAVGCVVYCSVLSYGPGNGGNSILYNYGTLTLEDNVTLNIIGQNSGTTGACGINGAGGDSYITNYDTINVLSDSNITMNGGTALCTEGGDTIINSNGTFLINGGDVYQTTGIYSSAQGDCENLFNNKVSIQDGNFSCVSSGTATIVGTEMTQVDYRNDGIIDLDGSTNTAIWTFEGDTQKFLTWNSEFDSTTINWNSDKCKFGNRSPSSNGTLIFNETCTEYSFDNYYTELTNLKQIWKYNDENKTYPYSYVNYTCQVTSEFPEDVEYHIGAEFKWYKNDVLTPYIENATNLYSGIPYSSTAIVPSEYVSIDDNITCSVLLVSTNATCYQETANVSTLCGGLDTGAYDIPYWSSRFQYLTDDLIDGDWDTYSRPGPNYGYVTFQGLLYVNYSIPSETNSSLWKIKLANSALTDTAIFNIKIVDECIDIGRLDLKVYTYVVSPIYGDSYTSMSCYNGTDYTELYKAINYTRVYEEAVIFQYENILESLRNITNSSILTKVIPAYHNNFKIDIGNDGILEYNGTGIFNTTLQAIIPKDSLNKYLRDCTNDACIIPVRFYSDENATIDINDFNTSYGVDNVIDGLFNLEMGVFSEQPGTISSDNLFFDYNIEDGFVIPITAHDYYYRNSTTYNITLVESIFEQNLPDKISYWEMYPRRLDSQNVEPYGQTETQPIFNVTSNHTSENIDVYIKLKESWATQNLPCTELGFSRNNTSKIKPDYYYPFIGNANEVITNNDAIVSGATLTTDHLGNINNSYDFNYIEHLELPTPIIMGVGNYIEFWIKPISPSFEGNDSYKNGFFPVVVLSTDYYDSYIDLKRNRIQMQDTYGYTYYSGDYPTDFDNATWYNIIIVFVESEIKFYVNGNPLGTTTFFNNSHTLEFDRIGEGYSGYTHSHVQISDILVGSKELTDADALELYTYSSSSKIYPVIPITTTSYDFCSNIAPGGECNLWAYQDFNCTREQASQSSYNPEFIFDSICTDCVITEDAFSD